LRYGTRDINLGDNCSIDYKRTKYAHSGKKANEWHRSPHMGSRLPPTRQIL
jgi:hypothetical protein